MPDVCGPIAFQTLDDLLRRSQLSAAYEPSLTSVIYGFYAIWVELPVGSRVTCRRGDGSRDLDEKRRSLAKDIASPTLRYTAGSQRRRQRTE